MTTTVHRRLLRTYWLASLVASLATPVVAQDFGLGVTVSPTTLLVNTPFTYTLRVTNRSTETITELFVTNSLSPSVVPLGGNNTFGDVFTNAGNSVVFQILQLTNNAIAVVDLEAEPTAIGLITNRITIASVGTTNLVTNIVHQVYSAQADLGVALAVPQPGALVNDYIAYSLSITNRGPGTAPNVVVTNPWPVAFKLISIVPTNQSYQLTASNLTFSVGTFTNRQQREIQVRFQATNAGTFPLTASIGSAGLLDTNAANNFASNNIMVGGFLEGDLLVTNKTVNNQVYNPQNGLMEQTVVLVNQGTNAVPSARVFVSRLTNGPAFRLFNAVGTNDGRPFVVYATTLTNGDSVDVSLEYFFPNRKPITNLTFSAAAVPRPAFAVPTNSPLVITNKQMLPGIFLIEFLSTPGRNYSVVYADNPELTNALVAQPSITATADRTQWIDNGPPKTISPPTTAPARYYRVFANP